MVVAPLAVELGETLPQVAAEQETAQVTPSFAPSPVTIAVNPAVVPASTVAVSGTADTVIEPPPLLAPPLPVVPVPVPPPPVHPELPAARSATKTIPAIDAHFLSVMACLSFILPEPAKAFAALASAYCLLASRVMTVGRDVPLGSTTDVKSPRNCSIFSSNAVFPVTSKISVPDTKILTLIVPVQS